MREGCGTSGLRVVAGLALIWQGSLFGERLSGDGIPTRKQGTNFAIPTNKETFRRQDAVPKPITL